MVGIVHPRQGRHYIPTGSLHREQVILSLTGRHGVNRSIDIPALDGVKSILMGLYILFVLVLEFGLVLIVRSLPMVIVWSARALPVAVFHPLLKQLIQTIDFCPRVADFISVALVLEIPLPNRMPVGVLLDAVGRGFGLRAALALKVIHRILPSLVGGTGSSHAGIHHSLV